MEEKHGDNTALDHVNNISDTVFVLEFVEEAIMTRDSFSDRGNVGMEVIVREFRRKLARTRDFLLDHHVQMGETACTPVGAVLCPPSGGDAVGHRMCGQPQRGCGQGPEYGAIRVL